TDGDGLEQVRRMMTSLNLMGNSSQGPVMISLDPSQPSLGQIEEEVNTTPGVLDLAPFGAGGCARSYFDVNALIKVGARVLRPARSEERRVGSGCRWRGGGGDKMKSTDKKGVGMLG